jgi:hypothetical protein
VVIGRPNRIDMMNGPRILRLKPRSVFVIYVVLDVFCMGIGMGIPFVNIMFGFVVGWYLVRWISIGMSEAMDILKRLLIYSAIAAGVTFLGMLLIWGWCVKMLFDPAADIVNFGIPQILFEPRMSLIGWILLMIVISPFLQLLATVFAGTLTLLSSYKKKNNELEKSGATV